MEFFICEYDFRSCGHKQPDIRLNMELGFFLSLQTWPAKLTTQRRPDLLDSSLMRPGRLDKLLYVGVAQHPQDKLKVLLALTRKFLLAPDVNLQSIADQCGAMLTGADLYALCADAWMAALRRLIAGNKVTYPLWEAVM